MFRLNAQLPNKNIEFIARFNTYTENQSAIVVVDNAPLQHKLYLRTLVL